MSANRRLLLTWAMLMGLTFLTGLAGVGGADRLGVLWLAVLAVVTVVKARLILARYLRLEVAPSFLGGFTASVVAVVALIAVSVALISRPLIAPSHGLAPKPMVLSPNGTKG